MCITDTTWGAHVFKGKKNYVRGGSGIKVTKVTGTEYVECGSTILRSQFVMGYTSFKTIGT
jgi:hypothetical protein